MIQLKAKKLKLLDKMILACTDCSLCNNGHAKPFWTENSKYAIIGEAPGRDEIKYNTPFVGRAGNLLWSIFNSNGFTRDDFLVINSVNCRPVVGNANGKPTNEEMNICRKWIRKYLKVFAPEKVMVLGSYALFTMHGDCGKISSMNGKVIENNEFNVKTILSVHPAYALRNPYGLKQLNESIEVFRKEIKI